VVKDLLLDPRDIPIHFNWNDEGLRKFIHILKSTSRKFSIFMISDLQVMEILEEMKGLSEFRVFGSDEFQAQLLEGLIISISEKGGEVW